MKKFLIAFIAICLIIMMYSLANKKDTSGELEVVGELIESIEDSEYNTMVCTKKGGDFFTEQKIYINFDFNEIVEEVIIEEKYSNREIASSAYETISSNSDNDEVILDGTTLSYNATKTFGYEGMSKEEVTEIMNGYKNDGINTGYVITWE